MKTVQLSIGHHTPLKREPILFSPQGGEHLLSLEHKRAYYAAHMASLSKE